MPYSRRLLFVIVLVLILGSFLSRSAYAYLDPGSGSFFIQMIIAALVAIPLTFKWGWNKISAFFSLIFKKDRKKPKGPAS